MSFKQTDSDKFPPDNELEYEHILALLEEGREIEFKHKDQDYIIAYEKKGRAIWQETTQISNYYGDRHKEILDTAEIDGIKLTDLFKNKKAEITFIL